MLVGALAGVAVSQTSVMLSHTLQFAVLLAVFTNLTQHTVYVCWRKRVPPFRFGPAYATMVATILIMVHPTYLVLKIGKQVEPIGDGRCGMHSWGHPLHVCTIIGYVFLCIGAVWAADVFGENEERYEKEDCTA